MTGKTEGAQSIARAALLLRTLSTFGATGASLMQISMLTNLPKATVHRILAAMIGERLIERPAGTRHYRLGPDIFAFGFAVRESFDLKQVARPSLDRLASETGAAIYLGVRSGYDMLCLDKSNGASEPQALLLEVHDRWPLGIGSFSLAMLAFLTEAEIDEVVEFNQRRIREEDTLTFKHIRRSIQKTRRNGFAKRTTRSYRGLAGVAAPVFDDRRYPIASLCAVSDASSMHGSYLTELAQKLMREAALITKLYESGRLQLQQQEKWRLAVRGSARGLIPE
ncbi:MAG: IclR family transcriptional regulator [Herminiimonas sp.]|jgi:DNA-binding IclR family transcriptional regulator|nr:IclR family transcriptional regulator [Herminiimonas sp.]